jgi:hypothetical protein
VLLNAFINAISKEVIKIEFIDFVTVIALVEF